MKSQEIVRWWPLTQSFDLVKATPKQTSVAVKKVFSQFTNREPWRVRSTNFDGFDAAFSSVRKLTNVPTVFLVFPTHSKWSVLWSNSFLCDGYDSLCYNLTKQFQVETIHFTANDSPTVTDSGALVTFRRHDGATILERTIYSIKEDSRWTFYQRGDPLSFENLERYRARRKRDRLNETSLMEMFALIGIHPWSVDFYDFSGQECYRIQRLRVPKTITSTPISVVIGKK